ncbi:MAG: heat shock protein transcriptional repressor HspR [Rhodoluna sp.]|jgi:MerR family transcriptional regulator/heat shock protein HspR
MNNIDPDAPILTIAAAAELARMHPQTLRQYDRMGLVKPSRTIGQSRRYTLRNVSQLAEVAKLSSEGVSLIAIKRIMDLENYVVDMKQRVNELEKLVEELVLKQPGARVFAVGDSGTVSLPSGKRPKKATSVELFRKNQ